MTHAPRSKFSDVYTPFIAERDEARKLAATLAEALRELLLGGMHEYTCTNEGMEREDSCDLHVEAANDRAKQARTALIAYDKAKVPQ